MSDVADELAIRDLVARFTDAVNRRATDEFADLFTDDGEWVVPGMPECRGGAAAGAQLAGMLEAFAFLVQLVHSGRVQVDGDQASARWYITEWAADGEGGGSYFVGTYHDQLVRTGDGWRFTSRRFDFLWLGRPEMKGKAKPFPEVPAGAVPWPS
ncbi:MAG: nuclear transport factor 2 family protein [Acidimicrobiia bacterium]